MTMTLRAFVIVGGLGLTVGLAGCTRPTPPPRVVATLPPVAPPPVMPVGGYPEVYTAPQRANGTYITPNFDMSDSAAVWHLRGALNVAALGCDKAGGGVVDGYNAWLKGHVAVLAKAQAGYLHDWEQTGWGDWRNAYENQQTRLYNFYSQSPIRVAFCAAARLEIVQVGSIADAELPRFARASLVRLDQPFIDFYTQVDAWRDYYAPKVPAPRVVPTIPEKPAVPKVVSPTLPAVTGSPKPVAAPTTPAAKALPPVAPASRPPK